MYEIAFALCVPPVLVCGYKSTKRGAKIFLVFFLIYLIIFLCYLWAIQGFAEYYHNFTTFIKTLYLQAKEFDWTTGGLQ